VSPYRGQVAAALAAVSLRGPLGYVWLGRPGRTLPAWLRDGMDDAERRAFLLSSVRGELYASFYCRGRVEPARWREPQPVAGDPWLLEALAAANAGSGGWEPGWSIERIEGEVAVVRSPALRARVPLSACRADDGPPQPGADASLRLASERPGLSPGHLTLVGGELDGDVVRVYWHVIAAGAVELVRALTSRLEADGFAYRFKLAHHPLGFNRADAAVLYLRAEDFPPLRTALAGLAEALAHRLRPRVPAFTLPLAAGVGLAEDPGESFGEHRCRLLAEGILEAREHGARGRTARSERVMARFARAGVDIDAPYLEPAMEGRHVL
jgi:hypothetical protein